MPVDQCGAALASEIIADRWTLLIIREAFYGVMRYDDIREDIQIPRSVLTHRLKRLVDNDILQREPYQEDGARARFGYVLTEKGKELGLTILALMQWGDKHLKNGVAAIDILDAEKGDALKVGLVPQSNRTIPLSKVSIKVRDVSSPIGKTGLPL
ncbi:MAG: transcriptional regulator [Hyphococcus sp.]|nr:MAG: transcriptional regulator [Marinicaulis sp.]